MEGEDSFEYSTVKSHLDVSQIPRSISQAHGLEEGARWACREILGPRGPGS